MVRGVEGAGEVTVETVDLRKVQEGVGDKVGEECAISGRGSARCETVLLG